MKIRSVHNICCEFSRNRLCTVLAAGVSQGVSSVVGLVQAGSAVLLAHLLLASYHVRCVLGASSESLFKIVAEENTSTTKLKKLVGKKEKNEKTKLQCN